MATATVITVTARASTHRLLPIPLLASAAAATVAFGAASWIDVTVAGGAALAGWLTVATTTGRGL